MAKSRTVYLGLIMAAVASLAGGAAYIQTADRRASTRSEHSDAPTHTTTSNVAIVPTATDVRIFQPFNADGSIRGDLRVVLQLPDGECQTGAFSVSEDANGKRAGRPDAWRCGARDPCFSPTVGQILVCAHDPFSGEVTALSLKSPLQRDQGNEPRQASRPWAIELANGERCAYAGAGTVQVVAGQRALYVCDLGTTVFGAIDTTPRVWTAMAQLANSHELRTVEVRVAYR